MKNIKRVVSLFLALVLCVGLAVPSMAAKSITVKDDSGTAMVGKCSLTVTGVASEEKSSFVIQANGLAEAEKHTETVYTVASNFTATVTVERSEANGQSASYEADGIEAYKQTKTGEYAICGRFGEQGYMVWDDPQSINSCTKEEFFSRELFIKLARHMCR